MKIRNKALLLTLCVALLTGTSMLGTFAYLTDHEAVTNTFTVGAVGLKLDELDVDNDDNKGDNVEVDGVVRDKANEYHLLPGHTYIKDPTATVDAKSEDAYVRMIVDVERIDQLKAALPKCDSEGKEIEANQKYYNGDLFLLQMLCNGWDNTTWVYEGYTQAENSTTGTYEFRYKEVVAESDSATKLPALFQSITVPGEIDNDHLAYLEAVKIVVNAHAIQADGFDNADEAWNAFD